MLSPSSRRAWIEIGNGSRSADAPGVALLAEGVDRNQRKAACFAIAIVALLAEGVDRNMGSPLPRQCAGSPSSRRAWIEICMYLRGDFPQKVALLAEGVGRNYGCIIS